MKLFCFPQLNIRSFLVLLISSVGLFVSACSPQDKTGNDSFVDDPSLEVQKIDEPIEEEQEAMIGIESAESEVLDEINLERLVFIGQCPGVVDKKTSGYFVDYDLPTQKGLKIELTNYARGLSPQKPPFVARKYDTGRASDVIKFKIGKAHKTKYFTVKEGLNPIKYQIIDTSDNENIILNSGTFMLNVNVLITEQVRNQEWSSYSNDYYCPVYLGW